jgi:hypothetical protein
MGQRDAVDRPAPVVQDLLRALDGRFAVDDPPLGPEHLGPRPVRPFLTHPVHKQPAQARREGVDGNQGRGAARPPLAPVGGDATGGYAAVHVRLVLQRASPGVEPTPHPDATPNIMRVRGERDDSWRRGAAPAVIAIVLVVADECPQVSGPGQHDLAGGDRQEFLAPRLQPRLGVLVLAFGATAVAAGVVHVVFRTAPLALMQENVPNMAVDVHGESLWQDFGIDLCAC